MSLFRLAGLIALPLMATTLQASARPAAAAEDQRPSKPAAPAPKVSERPVDSRPVLEIAPSTDALSDHCPRLFEGGKPLPPLDLPADSISARRPCAANLLRIAEPPAAPIQATRPWLVARYPHGPPAVS